MKRKILTIIGTLLLIITVLFSVGSRRVYAGEEKVSEFDTEMKALINEYIGANKIPSWHSKYANDARYQRFFYKMVILCASDSQIQSFANLSESDLQVFMKTYDYSDEKAWDLVFANLDIEPEHLEPDEIVGLYWQVDAYNTGTCDFLYLIWTSRYIPCPNINILEFMESNKIYKLYDSQKDAEDGNYNWPFSLYCDFKDYDLTIYATPIGGFEGDSQIILPLKQNYKIEGIKYGLDKAQYDVDPDPTNKILGGKIVSTTEFDLGLVPQRHGKESLQLCTHAYQYITDIEVQSYYDQIFGGYKHTVHFNLDIDPDKIYRVDTKYTITNDDKKWYQFWLPNDEHTILKSLTPDKSRGGVLGLFQYQGFKEGTFSSVANPYKKYKYELLLDYDDKAWLWKIFTGQEYKESDYRSVADFQILRINYVADNQTYDVPIKMDTIDGETYNILSPHLIEDEASATHKVKKWTSDTIDKIATTFNKNKVWMFVALGAAGTILLFVGIIKIIYVFRVLMVNPKNNDREK